MDKPSVEKVEQSLFQRAQAWGNSSLPPSLLATLILPQHARPLQVLPMLFPPVLLFTSYLNLQGFKTDAAGLSAAWSGLYLLLASRRKQKTFSSKFGVRGVVRGATLALCAVNLAAGGAAYVWGSGGKQDGLFEGKD